MYSNKPNIHKHNIVWFLNILWSELLNSCNISEFRWIPTCKSNSQPNFFRPPNTEFFFLDLSSLYMIIDCVKKNLDQTLRSGLSLGGRNTPPDHPEISDAVSISVKHKGILKLLLAISLLKRANQTLTWQDIQPWTKLIPNLFTF